MDTTNVNDKKALAHVALKAKKILQKETIEVLADKGKKQHTGKKGRSR